MANTIHRSLQKTTPADISITGGTFTAYALSARDMTTAEASDTFYVVGPSSPDVDALWKQFALMLDGKPYSPRTQKELSDFVNWLAAEQGFVKLEKMVVFNFAGI